MKFNKFTRIFTLAIVLSLLTALLPSTTVLAAGTLNTYPSRGEVGDNIEIYGSGFDVSYYDFYFSNESADVADRIDTEVQNYEHLGYSLTDSSGDFQWFYFDVPAELSDGDDDIRVHGGTYYIYATTRYSTTIQAETAFTVDAVASITSLSPTTGEVGTEVEIDGEGYNSNEDIIVKFDGTTVTIAGGDDDADSNGEFDNTKIIIPPSTAGAHTITVTGDDSDLEAEDEFTVIPDITISPESGASGTLIAVQGTGFGDEVAVSIYFNSSVVTQVNSDEDGNFSASFTPVIAEGLYTIEALDEDSNSDDAGFSIGAATLSLLPNQGNIGATVAVTGSGFIANTEVTIEFEGSVVGITTSDASGGISASFTVPALTVGDYDVIASDGTNTTGMRFEIMTSTDISPVTSAALPGKVGDELTISGIGFTPSGAVLVTYDGTQVATTTAAADGNFSVSFNVPASTGGTHTIVATQGTNTHSFTFHMETTAPATPPPLLPEIDTKASAEAYFDWDDVTDPSGVTYSLQIATSGNFTQSDIVLEKTGIIGSEYTLTREERLNSVSKEVPYYWRIKAMDNASNESNWSSICTFYVGFSFSISQPVIYVIIGICAITLAVFAFWMGRKTAYY
ncbi:IPT/TIG domain-containing protein [Chloroflexota bacterium]